MLLFSFVLPVFFPRPAVCLERLSPPAFLKGNPGLVADFNFSPGPSGKTQVELALGGKFKNILLPKNAARAPRLEISCEFQPKYKISQEPQAKGGLVDLKDVLSNQAVAFRRSAFGPGASLSFQASVFVDLAPGEYSVMIRAKDPGLGLETEKGIHVTVPATSSPLWGLGDLRFRLGLAGEKGQGKAADSNPFRQYNRKSGFPLAVSYVFPALPADWEGNSLIARSINITRLPARKKPVVFVKELLPLPNPGIPQTVELSSKKLEALSPGRYLMLLEIVPLVGNGKKIHAYKSFEVLK